MYVMLIALIILIVCVVCINHWYSYDTNMFELAAFLSGITLAAGMLCLPLSRMNTYSLLAQRDALEATYHNERAYPLEMATVGRDVAEWNSRLAVKQYWHNTQWRWWIPDDVMKAKPIK